MDDRKITFWLEGEVFEALHQLSNDEKRPVKLQIEFMLEKELERRGLLIPKSASVSKEKSDD